MSDDPFGPVTEKTLEVDDDGNIKFPRKDLQRYRDFIVANLVTFESKKGVGISVPTGELNDKGRGKLEYADERGFKEAAHEMGKAMKINKRHRGDGMTDFVMALVDKREISEETQANRNAALEKGRLTRAQARVTATQQALAQDPNNAKLKEAVATAKEKLAEATEKYNGGDGASVGASPAPTGPKTPAAKAAAAKK